MKTPRAPRSAPPRQGKVDCESLEAGEAALKRSADVLERMDALLEAQSQLTKQKGDQSS
jgi:hypothetical protein